MKFLVNGKTNRYRLLYTLLLVLAAGQIFLGFIWIVKNMGTVPAYGDTPEYLALSKTMALDGYRTFLYPLFLREVIKASTFLHLQYQIIAYLCQLFVSFVSLVYFTGTFFVQNRFLTRAYEKNKIRTAVETLLLSLFIFANPLVAHFNLSILTDSFALSFTLIFLGAIVRMLLFERLRARDIAVGLARVFLYGGNKAGKEPAGHRFSAFDGDIARFHIKI